VGITAQKAGVRDLWAHKDLGTQATIDVTLAPHATVLWKVIAQ
jgi:hypothetical protein